MATNVQEIIKQAYNYIGALGAGEVPDASLMQSGLLTLNLLLENLSLDIGNIYSTKYVSLPATPNKTVYTWGIAEGGRTPADWVAQRPQRVLKGNFRWAANGQYPVDYPMEMIDYSQYQNINIKTITSTLPRYFFVEYAAPFIKVYVYPLSLVSNGEFVFAVTSDLPSGLRLSDDLNLPRGYEMYVILRLATQLAPQVGLDVSPTVAALLDQSAANVRTSALLNRGIPLRGDAGSDSSSPLGSFYSGGYR